MKMASNLKYFIFSSQCSLCFGLKSRIPQSLILLKQQIPKQFRSEPVVILKDSLYLSLESAKDSNIVKEYRCRVYFVQDIYPPLLQTISVYQNESIEFLPHFTIRIYYPSKRSLAKKGKNIESERILKKGLYNTNLLVKQFNLPKYKKGMIIELEEQRIYFKPEFHNYIQIGDNYPIIKQYINLCYPHNYSLVYQLSELDSILIDTNSYFDNFANKDGFMCLAKNIRGYNSLIRRKTEARLYLSLPPLGTTSYSWQSLGNYYLLQLERMQRKSKLIASLSSRINTRNESAIVKQAHHILRKKVRYHIDSRGKWAFFPRSIDEILTNGYGDCKELCLLLQALLREKGITTHFALVPSPTNEPQQNAPPSLGKFDHIILFYDDASGTRYFFDPTVSFGDPYKAYYFHINKKILLLKKNGSRIDTVKMLKNFTNQIVTNSQIIQSAQDNRWKIEGNIRLTGMSAFLAYAVFNNSGTKKLNQFLGTFLNRSFNLLIDTVRIITFNEDTISLFYRNDYDRKIIDLKKKGIILDLPCINNIFGIRKEPFANDDILSFCNFSQKDIWQIPYNFKILKKNDFNHPFGQLKWSKNQQQVIRTFIQKTSLETSLGENEIREYNQKRIQCSKAVIWKK